MNLAHTYLMGIPFNISVIAINAQSRTAALIKFQKNNFPKGYWIHNHEKSQDYLFNIILIGTTNYEFQGHIRKMILR